MTFYGHSDSEAIQVDETFVEIHAEDDDQPTFQSGHDMNPSTNMDLLMDTDMDQNTWASQGFDFNRRPLRSQPRPTNRELNRGSCFF